MPKSRSHWTHREPRHISKWLLRMMIALIGLCLLAQLSGCSNTRTVYEFGEVQARSQSLNGKNQYFIHYQAADKCATERWYNESQLVAVEDDRSPNMPVFGCVDLPEGAVVEN